MSNTDKTDAQGSETAELSFADQVNSLANEIGQGDDGKMAYPEGEYSSEVKYAATIEKRRRISQGARAKASQDSAAVRAENEELRKRLGASVKVDSAAVAELEDLKFADPEKWRHEMNKLEQSAAATLRTELDEVTAQSSEAAEIERRKDSLEQFKQNNPGFDLTDDMLAYDIPPRYTKKLEAGKVTFEEFLGEVKEFMSKGKVIGDGTQTLDQPDLGSMVGGNQPAAQAQRVQTSASYSKEIY